jgi:hypothetical protein
MDNLASILRLHGADRLQLLFETRDGLRVEGLPLRTDVALILWEALAERADDFGVWPVILPITSPQLAAPDIRYTSAESILAAADRIKPSDLMSSLWDDSSEYDPDEAEVDPEYQDYLDETFPDGIVGPIRELILNVAAENVLALVPATSGDQAIAVLGFGGWNACPPPEIHVAVLRYWNSVYGARLQAMSYDIIELVVDRPPKDSAEAVSLAREQFAYANDIVLQGGKLNTIGLLAKSLLSASRWVLWWD